MKNNKIIAAVFAVLVSAAISARAAGSNMEALSGAADRVSSIDLDKNLSEAGNVLGGFYSGSKAKPASDTSVVYAEQRPAQAPGHAEKDICNAKPSKIGKLGFEVKPLAAASGGALAAQTRGSSWTDDLNTVVDYVGHVCGHAVDTAADVGSVAYHGPTITEHSDGHVSSNVTDVAIDAYHTYQAATCND